MSGCGTQLGVRPWGRAVLGDLRAPPSGFAGPRRVHFHASTHATTGFVGGYKPSGKVGALSGGHCYSLVRPAAVGLRSGPRRPLSALLRLPWEYDWPLLATVADDRSRAMDGVCRGTQRVSGEFCRHSTRPVLKHGPRSLTCARVIGLYETQRHSESEGRFGRSRWDPSSAWRGRTTGPSRLRCQWGGARACTLGPERW